MLTVVISICLILIICNAIYNTDETEVKKETVESKFKNEIK